MTFAQQPAGCGGCSDGSCSAPYSGATCQNNVWVYPGDLTFTGTVELDCAISITGDVHFGSGTTMNLIPCAHIAVGGSFNAPADGLNIIVDFLGDPNPFGSKFTFATYKGSFTGHIGYLEIAEIGGTEPIHSLGGRLGNGEAAIAFNPTGNPNEGNGDLGKPKALPGFDDKGNRLNVCPQLICSNPTVCPSPIAGSVCDPSGAWVVPGPVNAQSLTVTCPTHIQGDLTVLGSITVGGCGRLTVSGTARLSSAQGVSVNRIPVSSHIYVLFDMNDYGTPSSNSDHITWLTAGHVAGGIYGASGANIWGASLSIANQKCGNTYSILYYPSGSQQPPAICASANSQAFSDADEDFTAAVGEFNEEAAVGEFNEEAATADNVDELVSNEYLDNAATDTQNTNTNTADSNAAPTYAYALFVLAVLVLIALVIVQVQIILIRRARESARI